MEPKENPVNNLIMLRYLIVLIFVSCSSKFIIQNKKGVNVFTESELTELYNKNIKKFNFYIDKVQYNKNGNKIKLNDSESIGFIEIDNAWGYTNYNDINYIDLMKNDKIIKKFYASPEGIINLFISKKFAYLNSFSFNKHEITGKMYKSYGVTYKIVLLKNKISVSLLNTYTAD